ncbi:MAG: hypothetical protein MUC48_25635 [Leptolyngbya sp. Prado105]|jgi:hypothetical protein|nr:hypothetical protein [Leptolyngbya sp. Prado105]
MSKKISDRDVHAPINNAPADVRQIIQRVLDIEKERLDKNERSPINDDILKIIKEVVK